MKSPTPEQIAKLPKWARDHIDALTRQREEAVKIMEQMEGAQKKTPFFTEEFTRTQSPSKLVRVYHAAESRITVHHRDIELQVLLPFQARHAIELSWNNLERMGTEVAFVPTAFQQASLVSRKDMRV